MSEKGKLFGRLGLAACIAAGTAFAADRIDGVIDNGSKSVGDAILLDFLSMASNELAPQSGLLPEEVRHLKIGDSKIDFPSVVGEQFTNKVLLNLNTVARGMKDEGLDSTSLDGEEGAINLISRTPVLQKPPDAVQEKIFEAAKPLVERANRLRARSSREANQAAIIGMAGVDVALLRTARRLWKRSGRNSNYR